MNNNKNTYTNLYFKYPKSHEQLQELGFSYLGSSEDGRFYSYRFPIHYWKKSDGSSTPTLFCILTHNTETGKVIVDVKTTLDLPYPDFYHVEYGNPQPFLGQIHKKINLRLKDLGIIDKTVHKKRGNYDKTRSKSNRRLDRRSANAGERLLRERDRYKNS